MSKVKLLAAILVGMALLGRAFGGSASAETSSQSALTGQVTSQGEGAMEGVPGTPAQKLALGGCVNCHTLQRVLFSRFSADEMALVVQRMARHTNNSSLLHPWMRPTEGPTSAPRPAPGPSPFATYLSSINLS